MQTADHHAVRRALRLIGAIATALNAVSSASAQPVRGPAPDAGTLPTTVPVGTDITVQDTAGRRVKARFREWSGDALVVTTGGRTPMIRRFALDAIETVVRDDSRQNGFWIGFGVGAVPGIVLGSLFSRRCDNESSRPCPGAMALFGALTALGGGGVGAGLDGAFHRGAIIFSRRRSGVRLEVGPLVDPIDRRGGVALSLDF